MQGYDIRQLALTPFHRIYFLKTLFTLSLASIANAISGVYKMLPYCD